jgi:hypothetical protein
MVSSQFQFNGSGCAEFKPEIHVPRLMLRQAQQSAWAIHIKTAAAGF